MRVRFASANLETKCRVLHRLRSGAWCARGEVLAHASGNVPLELKRLGLLEYRRADGKYFGEYRLTASGHRVAAVVHAVLGGEL